MNAKKPDSERVTMTITEAARMLGLGRGGAYLAVSRGDLPAIRIGRRLLVPRAALERLLDSAGQRSGA